MFFNEIKTTNRLSIIETKFSILQERMIQHMDKEEAAFKELSLDLKEISSQINESKIESRENMALLQNEVLGIVAREFTTKEHLNKQLTELRRALTNDIILERKRIRNEFLTLIMGFSAATYVGVWIYTNLINT